MTVHREPQREAPQARQQRGQCRAEIFGRNRYSFLHDGRLVICRFTEEHAATAIYSQRRAKYLPAAARNNRARRLLFTAIRQSTRSHLNHVSHFLQETTMYSNTKTTRTIFA